MTVSLCDTNIWIALSIEGHVHHAVSRDWFEGTGERDSIAFCRATRQSFLRILTLRPVWERHGRDPLTCDEAWSVYDALLDDPRVTFVDERSPQTDGVWRNLTSRSSASPNLWMDAYLAAFAITEGLQLVTLDSAFTQFEGLDLLLLDPGT